MVFKNKGMYQWCWSLDLSVTNAEDRSGRCLRGSHVTNLGSDLSFLLQILIHLKNRQVSAMTANRLVSAIIANIYWRCISETMHRTHFILPTRYMYTWRRLGTGVSDFVCIAGIDWSNPAMLGQCTTDSAFTPLPPIRSRSLRYNKLLHIVKTYRRTPDAARCLWRALLLSL